MTTITEWTPATTMPPADEQLIITYIHRGDQKTYVIPAIYMEDDEEGMSYMYYDGGPEVVYGEVTAWALWPEPYNARASNADRE